MATPMRVWVIRYQKPTSARTPAITAAMELMKTCAPPTCTEAIVSHGVGMPCASTPKMTMVMTLMIAPTKMVRMMVMTTSRPTSGRRTTRSTKAASSPVMMSVAKRATIQGSPAPVMATITKAPAATRSPWAKLKTWDAR